MSDDERREITELEVLRSLAQPRRQQIIQHLTMHGPATSATLARALDLNTGATSYHLRELARQGFVEEVPDQTHGRQRWWRYVKRDIRFAPRGGQDEATRVVFDEMTRQSFAADVEAFHRSQAETAEDGEWVDGLPYSRGTIRVSMDQLRDFFEEYIALLNRYAHSDRDDARTVLTRFLAFPAPSAPTADSDED
ncbi:helix-turn-helix domain-containing protein [Phytomonospora sp. NPDC050363]|uniref:helix-turn-helix domain-containing protein n=1 Tax=Phytomonospora sp. NPDC050363 TaxID=3155642 RepID=UPI003402C83A